MSNEQSTKPSVVVDMIAKCKSGIPFSAVTLLHVYTLSPQQAKSTTDLYYLKCHD